jgi:probable biosynthetic protein (TIGR04098 family)
MHSSIFNSEVLAELQSAPESTTSQFSLELGMPHLGRNNLSENALFKAIGHDRWKRIQELGGTPSALIHDEVGSRLYATFFFLEIDLPRELPLSSFGENSTIEFISNLSHFNKVYLDGRYVLADRPDCSIRASNVFIYQERGPSKLSLAVPVNMSFAAIPELPSAPDSLAQCRQAKSKGAFFEPQPGDVPLFAGERELAYRIDPDRDLNGAGLIYFANFICFLDMAERHVLNTLNHPVPPELLDARSTHSRRIGYFGNTQSNDSLHIFVRARGQLVRTDSRMSFDFGFDFRIRRSCDNKEILVSSCRKIAPIQPGTDSERWASAWMEETQSQDKAQETRL